jgi:hypothetical protein
MCPRGQRFPVVPESEMQGYDVIGKRVRASNVSILSMINLKTGGDGVLSAAPTRMDKHT